MDFGRDTSKGACSPGTIDIHRTALAECEKFFKLLKTHNLEAIIRRRARFSSSTWPGQSYCIDRMDYLTRKIINYLSSREGRGLSDAETRFILYAARDQSGQTARCEVDRMAVLLSHRPELIKTVGAAALHAAIQFRGTEEAIELLLERGVRSCDLGPGQVSPLHTSVRNNNLEGLLLVLKAGVGDAACTMEQANAEGLANISLLYWVAHLGLRSDFVGLLSKHGADTEKCIIGNGERGNTVLQEAVAYPLSPTSSALDPVWLWRKHEVARSLIDQGARYDIFSAAGLDDLDRVRQLVADDPGAAWGAGEGGMTPLHWAARNNATKCAAWLLKRKADPEALNLAQRSAMHTASDWNHVDMLWLLAAAGAEIDVTDAAGRTPLHRATFLGRVEAAEVLILLGADTDSADFSGKTPLDIARPECSFLQARR
jgi:hypothetical protein